MTRQGMALIDAAWPTQHLVAAWSIMGTLAHQTCFASGLGECQQSQSSKQCTESKWERTCWGLTSQLVASMHGLGACEGALKASTCCSDISWGPSSTSSQSGMDCQMTRRHYSKKGQQQRALTDTKLNMHC